MANNTIKTVQAAANQNTQITMLGRWIDIEPEPTGTLSVGLGDVEIEHGKRYLLTAKPDGTPFVREIEGDCAIANTGRYLEMMTEPNGSYVRTEVLVKFVESAMAILESRRQYEISMVISKQETGREA